MSAIAATERPHSGAVIAEAIGVPHVVLAAFLIVYPAIASDFFIAQIGAYSLIFGTLALSLMQLAGYGGMVSLAQISVAGIAGYTVAVFGLNNTGVHGFGWPFWVLIPYATLIAAIASALVWRGIGRYDEPLFGAMSSSSSVMARPTHERMFATRSVR